MPDSVIVEREHCGEECAKIEYEKRGDGWYVRTPIDDGFWQFTWTNAVHERTVRNLIFKKWCSKWTTDPAPFDCDGRP